MPVHPLTKLIQEDMVPSLGVTEPGAIALAAAKARTYIDGEIRSICVRMNSGIYKNAFTCGIPGTDHFGAAYAAALGVLIGDPSLGLEVLAGVTLEAERQAEQMIKDGQVHLEMTGIDPDIFIEVHISTEQGEATATIRHTHTNIVSVVCNGKNMEQGGSAEQRTTAEVVPIHCFSLRELLNYARAVPLEEITFLRNAFSLNLTLLDAGLQDARTVVLHRFYSLNGDCLFSGDALHTAQLLCSGAIEARVLGIPAPAMSVTGSGSHGIIALMPLYAIARCEKVEEETLLRASALSVLVTQYIKEYSGKLSALCGCAIAAGSGAACGAVFLRGGDEAAIVRALNNMSLGITGMICDGGNHGCAIKSIVAVDTAFRAADLAMHSVNISSCHGICGSTPEQTMQNIGRIAAPGMIGTEEEILHIFCDK